MRSRLFLLLLSVLVLLFCTTLDVSCSSISIPRPPPGSKLVVVVGGRKDVPTGSSVISDMVSGASQLVGERKRMIMFPSASSQEEIKRQGISGKPMPTEVKKTEKSRLAKLIPTSARHISGINPGAFHQRHTEKRLGGGSHIVGFRPHQPDITADIQNNGKLSLPVMAFTEENGLGLGTPHPTPMANKINPYTNGVASSFPPGIDPYEGFIRYAAENLDTPTGNIVDYHSLEHYYGPQHPLSPHAAKNGPGSPKTQPYANSFGYGAGAETGNSPPPPPPGFHGPPNDFSDDISPGPQLPGPGGFRNHNNALGDGRGSTRSNNPNTVRQGPGYSGHGIDHFNAPSPGLDAAPPIRRPANPDASFYEEHHGHRTPPFEPHSTHFPSNNHGAPFKHPSSLQLNDNHGFEDDARPPGSDSHPSPEPPDLDVFEEGPPPPGNHPPVPRPPQGNENPHQHDPPNAAAENNDGGEDSIWGILDLAEMLDKGQIPGTTQGSGQKNGKPQSSPQSPSQDRLVVPIFTRPPPPRSFGENDSPPDDESPTPVIPSHPSLESPQDELPANSKGGYQSTGTNDGSFDYDDHHSGGNQRHQSSFGGPLESHESNDYGDDYNG